MQKTPENFEALKADWERLNAEYDAYIESFLVQGKTEFSEEEVATMKDMQEKLAEAETKVFKIIEERRKLAEE